MGEAALQAADGGNDRGETPGRITVGMLRETFEQWTIGEAAGRFLAFRRGYFADSGPASLIRGCVIAGSPEGLADQLCMQAWLESLTEKQVAALWRERLTGAHR
jgi:hypothetical protein